MIRSFWSRRRFFGAAAKTSAIVVASGWSWGCSREEASGLSPAGLSTPDRETLQRISYLLFPFPDVGPEPYARIAAAIEAAVEAEPATAALVSRGLLLLDTPEGGPWLELDEHAQLARLESIQGEPFFGYLLGMTKNYLFNDRTVWAHIGFDSSAPLNDIDWLGDE